jgi:hypothetical protein
LIKAGVGAAPVFRGEIERSQISLEDFSSPGGAADLFGISRPLDIERLLAPDRFKQGPVFALREPEHDTRGVRKPMFLSVDYRMLGLLRVGVLQLVSGSSKIPEIAAIKILLCFVVVERRVIR